MSCDGSSAKSYIRHATEKERLDQLAFSSFPEDYLPYTAAPGHSRAPPPPYLLWGEERRPRKRRKPPRCAGALLCAIGMVVAAILAVVAISVYLGVVTNLFRSPVVSLSGQFTSDESEDFSSDLLNSSSSKFLEKANLYKSKVEKAFYSSSLEPAFIAARIYAFRPGLLVFFRVYLDRRKMREGDPPTDLVRNLVAQRLAADPDTVRVQENEELLTVEPEVFHQPLPTTATTTTTSTTKQPVSKEKKTHSGGVGEWRPVPIEDSVSPSFAERPAGGTGLVRLPDPPIVSPPPPKDVSPPRIVGLGTGSASLLEESLLPAEGVGSVRLLDEQPRPPLLTRGREPPSLAPSVSLVVRKPRPPSRLAKIQLDAGDHRKLMSEAETRTLLPASEKDAATATLGDAAASTAAQDEKTSLKAEETPTTAQHNKTPLGAQNKTSLGDAAMSTTDQEKTSLGEVMSSTTAQNKTSLGDAVMSRTDPEKTHLGEVMSAAAAQNKTSLGDAVISTTDQDKASLGDAVMSTTDREKTSLADAVVSETGKEKTSLGDAKMSTADQEKTSLGDPVTLTTAGIKTSLGDAVTSTTTQDEETSQGDAVEIEPRIDTAETFPSSTVHENSETTRQQAGGDSETSTDQSLPEEGPAEEVTIKELFTLKVTPLEEILFNRSSQQTTTVGEISPRNMTSDATTTTTDLTTDLTADYSATGRDEVENNGSVPNPEETTTDQDIRSSIINYSQYLFDEPHHHVTVGDALAAHTLEGHGFHSMPSSRPPVEFLEYSFNRSGSNGSGADFEGWSSAEEEETANASQQAKIVPQVVLSNAIGELEEDDFEDEILRHVTPFAPQANDSSSVAPEECPPGSVSCGVGGQCGTRCDLRKDCPNNADERGCTCSDLLRAMGQSQKICDGVDDCADQSDETGCPWCPSSDHFVCPGSRACVALEQVCDGRDDCPAGQDEKRCVSLANSSADAGSSGEYGSEGYLIIRKRGRWGKLCLDTLPASPDTDRRIADLGKAVCSALTFRNMTSSVRSIDKSGSEVSFYQILTDAANNRSSAVTSIFESTSCEEKKVLKVQCATLECGLRPSASPPRRRIVGGRSAEGAGAWPWSAALYREGEFQCGAALLSEKWLLSAAHCFYSSVGAHWTARLGVLRRGSELPSGGEEVRRIDRIVLHPEYEDVGFVNDIALLRMEEPVPFSDSLRPICLPSSPREDATLWHGQRCSVVGWGKLYEIGHTFPDSLQEVRLPVISSSECQKRSIFLPAYRITSRMFCAGYDRGGRDACLGDSGGPMACQRPADGRWMVLGVTSNGDGCGRPGRPGVYSQVSGFLAWIHQTLEDEMSVGGVASGTESACRGGVRCRLGRCVPGPRVCDGRRDCAGGEDEEGCS